MEDWVLKLKLTVCGVGVNGAGMLEHLGVRGSGRRFIVREGRRE